MNKNNLVLIDAYGLCYRAYYAVKALTNSKGEPTNAIFGFCNILRKLLADLNPTHIAACFDVGKVTHRQDKFKEYKIQRQSMPDDLVKQIPVIHSLLEAFNIPIVSKEGYEADDVMATLAHRLSATIPTIIVTEDKDMCQLISNHVHLYSARQGKLLNKDYVIEKFGVNPDQVTDYLALAGDTSDNIPGVDGIGEVTAKKLLTQFKHIEDLYDHLDQVANVKWREKLANDRDNAFLSKELATTHHDIPIDVPLDYLKRQEPDTVKLTALFDQLEFHRAMADFGLVQQEPVIDIHCHVNVGDISVVEDLKKSLKEGIALKKKVFDVHLAGYLLMGGQGNGDIASLSWKFLNQKPHQDILKDLYPVLSKTLHEQGMDHLFFDIEQPLTYVLVAMEKVGVKLDVSVLNQMSEECALKIKELEDKLFEIAGQTFNMNSPKQLSEVLFEKLKLPVIKKTKTGFSTDEEVLTKLSLKHPLPALILEYRQLAKLKSTYLDALPQLVNSQTGRIHATFNQIGAETGRLSSYDPNLQNIPIRTDLGRRIRKAFVPLHAGDVLLSADYSQIELRILAHLSNDMNLMKAFKEDGDIHRFTAAQMFDVSEDQVDEKMRYAAKRINFGIIYGMSSFGLSKDLDVNFAQAQDFIDRYFLRYPGVKIFMDQEIAKAKEQGYVTTLFNRRRYLPDIHNRNIGLRQFAERQAINTPVQGTAADLIKLAMVNIDRSIKEHHLKSQMIMTVHDELVFNTPQDEVQALTKLVKSGMENAMKLSVPLKASVKVGTNWLEMDKL